MLFKVHLFSDVDCRKAFKTLPKQSIAIVNCVTDNCDWSKFDAVSIAVSMLLHSIMLGFNRSSIGYLSVSTRKRPIGGMNRARQLKFSSIFFDDVNVIDNGLNCINKLKSFHFINMVSL